MPNFPTHALVGVVGGILFLIVLQFVLGVAGVHATIVPFYIPTLDGLVTWIIQWVAIILLLLLSSILPDCDHQNSTITHILLFIVNILITFSVIPYAVGYFPSDPLVHTACYIGLFIIISAITYAVFLALKPPHRGWVHGLLVNTVWAIMVFFIWGLNINMAIVAWVGFFSHLAADGTIKMW